MKRDKNKKIVLASTIVLGIAAITSSALAAYIITGGVNERTGEANTTTVDINNKVTNLTIETTDKTLNFASPEVVETGRVQDDGLSGKQDLHVEFGLKMEASARDNIPTLNVKITPSLVDPGNYLKVPEVSAITKDAWNDNSDGSFSYTLELDWEFGTAFGGMSPTEYFNNDPVGKGKDISEVVSTMVGFAAYVNGADSESPDDNLSYEVLITDKAI